MKIKFTICLILFATLGLYSAKFNPLHSRKNQPPPGTVAGAPGNGTCGSSSCHNTMANAGSGAISINFDMGGTDYIPGNTYNLTVSIQDATKSNWGFEAVAYDNTTNAQVGSFNTAANLANANLSYQTSGGDDYIGHSSANTATSDWTFEWVAPAGAVGDLTFYVSGIAGNDNNNKSGDNLYTNNVVISQVPVSVQNLLPDFVKVFPVPASTKLNITSDIVLDRVKLYSSIGKLVYSNGTFSTQQIDVTTLTNGLYFLEIEQSKATYQQKILISK